MNLKLLDLIESSKLQKIMSSFYKVAGIPMKLVNIDGSILATAGYTEFFSKFPYSCHKIGKETVRNQTTAVGVDHQKHVSYIHDYGNGLISIETPVTINRYQIGTVFQGQVFLNAPDLDCFRKQADLLGYNESEYIEAVRSIPVVDRNNIISAMEFVMHLCEIITELNFRYLSQLTEYRRSERLLKDLAFNDPLTGLANRTHFINRFEQELKKSGSQKSYGALLFLDLDDFKKVNDLYGHSVGDTLLKHIGEKLKSYSSANSIIARIGGDEFTILVTNTNSYSDISEFADKLLMLFNNSWDICGHKFYVTASIGVSIFPKDGNSIVELLKNADAAMYYAKGQGKNKCKFFDKSLRDWMMHQPIIAKDSEGASEVKEFRIFYQP